MATLSDVTSDWFGDSDDDGSTDTTDTTTTTNDGGNASRVTLLNRLANSPTAWVVSVLVGGMSFVEATEELASGKTALEILFNEFIFVNILRPFGESLYNAAISMVESLMMILFGTNFRIGVGQSPVAVTSDGTVMESVKIGLVDIPVFIMSMIADVIVSTVGDFTGAIDQINQGVANAIAPAGIFAPPIVAAIWGVQIVATVWAITLVVKAIDIPVIRAVPIIETIMAPFRAIGGLLFGR